jgi:hypothetical protein
MYAYQPRPTDHPPGNSVLCATRALSARLIKLRQYGSHRIAAEFEFSENEFNDVEGTEESGKVCIHLSGELCDAV